MKLLVVTAFHSGDIDAAVRLYDWIKELGGIDNDVLLVHDPQDDRFKCNRVLLAAKRAAKSVTRIQTAGTHKRGWPHGPNAAFLASSKWALDNKRNFLWLETDCVPLNKDWLKELEVEYVKCGKKYLGGIVKCEPPLPPEVMYGVAVYHHTAFEIAAKALREHPGYAFDVAMSNDTAPIAHASRLLQLSKPDAEKRISNGVMLYHSDKNGELIKALQKKPVAPAKAKIRIPGHIELHEIPCFVQLGRIGDILNIIPMLRYWSSIAYHEMVPIMLHSDYAHVVSRIGYVRQIEWTGDLNDLDEAVEKARMQFHNVYTCQLFSKKGINQKVLGHYNLDQWHNCGQHDNFKMYPLEIDQRNYSAEDKWFQKNRQTDKPLICYNLTGVSSPFAHPELVLDLLKREFSDCELWDLNELKTKYYTDQLAALDKCAVLLSIDTSTLHLAQASHCRYIALLSDLYGNGWSATHLRRTPTLSMSYGEVPSRLNEIKAAITDCIQQSLRFAKRIWHVAPRRNTNDERVARAIDQWERIYLTGSASPLHVWYTERDARITMNDKRHLPFLKDTLAQSVQCASDDDIVMFTNDDVVFTDRCLNDIRAKARYTGIVTASRIDVDNPILGSFKGTNGVRHLGRDLVAFRSSWLKANIDKIPDFVLGASEWDIVLAAIARKECNCITSNQNIGMMHPDCETSVGTLFHEKHDAVWNRTNNVDTSPSQKHNRLLAEEWFRANEPHMYLHWFKRL